MFLSRCFIIKCMGIKKITQINFHYRLLFFDTARDHGLLQTILFPPKNSELCVLFEVAHGSCIQIHSIKNFDVYCMEAGSICTNIYSSFLFSL